MLLLLFLLVDIKLFTKLDQLTAILVRVGTMSLAEMGTNVWVTVFYLKLRQV